MGKVILQMYVTLDGLVAGPNSELDWIFKVADEECGKYADDLLSSSGIILFGRVLSKEFLNYWPTDTSEFAGKINNLPKIIFSKTISTIEWPNVTVVKENLADEITRLKQTEDKNLILYGGAGIVQSFINLEIIDEYHLMVAPIALGNGLSLFKGLNSQLDLKLMNSKTTPSGVVISHYEPIRQ